MSPAFFSNYSTQAGALITAVSNLPGGYPGGATTQTNAVGTFPENPACALGKSVKNNSSIVIPQLCLHATWYVLG